MKESNDNSQGQNLKLYSTGFMAEHYQSHHDLLPAESEILKHIINECAGKPIMDIGVGAGRTTHHLLKLSTDYLGIDYSEDMIEHCRNRYPDVCFEHADARNLEKYSGSHYSFILFSNNGIDYVSHDDRLLVLRQINRLLTGNGWFAFSSHNKLVKPISPFSLRRFSTINPIKIIWRMFLYIQGIIRYCRLRKFTYVHDEHDVRVDGYFNYSFVTYYINPADQLKQLQAAGFDIVELYSSSGDAIGLDTQDTSPWIYYLVRKRASA